jgi:hypothetical protein
MASIRSFVCITSNSLHYIPMLSQSIYKYYFLRDPSFLANNRKSSVITINNPINSPSCFSKYRQESILGILNPLPIKLLSSSLLKLLEACSLYLCQFVALLDESILLYLIEYSFMHQRKLYIVYRQCFASLPFCRNPNNSTIENQF